MAKILEISPKIELRLSSVHLGILSVLLLLHVTEIITMNSLFFKSLLFWIAINLLAFPVARRRFITPRLASAKCHFCGSEMITTELYCEKCKSFSKIPKPEK